MCLPKIFRHNFNIAFPVFQDFSRIYYLDEKDLSLVIIAGIAKVLVEGGAYDPPYYFNPRKISLLKNSYYNSAITVGGGIVGFAIFGTYFQCSFENRLLTAVVTAVLFKTIFGERHFPKITSCFDSDITIDHDRWAITLIDTNRGDGHAAIVIERVINYTKSILRTDLCKISKNILSPAVEKPQIDLREGVVYAGKVYGKTETWIRTKEKIERLIEEVNREIEGGVTFHLCGRGAFLSGLFATSKQKKEGFHNCITWAREKLELAEVFLPEPTFYKVAGATSPRDYIPRPDSPVSDREEVLGWDRGPNF